MICCGKKMKCMRTMPDTKAKAKYRQYQCNYCGSKTYTQELTIDESQGRNTINKLHNEKYRATSNL